MSYRPDTSARPNTSARLVAACLVTSTGIGHIASLWFRELDAAAVLALWVGGIYLIVGLGLFGQSRFTLFVASALCATSALQALAQFGSLSGVQWAGMTADFVAATCCGMALWGRQRLKGT